MSVPTHEFPCTHCGKRMAVAEHELGKEVRCPHCREVLTAPPSAEAVGVDAPLGPLTEAQEMRLFAPALEELAPAATEPPEAWPTTAEAPADAVPPRLPASNMRLIVLVVIPLLSYSILATVAVILLWLRLQNR